MALWQFNRGEWTEAYVFLRLLGDGRIYGADANLVKDDQTYIDIVNVIRDEPERILIYERIVEGDIICIHVREGESCINISTAPEMTEKAALLYDRIKADSSGKRKIEIEELQTYLTNLKVSSPKANLSNSAKLKYGDKTDIIFSSEDSKDHAHRTEGFSIKSHIGSAPTLFNSSSTSGFRYEIEGCTIDEMHRINAKDGFIAMISYIKDHRFNLRYVGCRNDCFEENLSIVDSSMDLILSEAMLLSVGYYDDCTRTSVKDITYALVARNSMNRRHPEIFYPAKMKDLLFASFAGLTATSLWNGRKKLTGGFIDVNRAGEMLYYRAISDDVFTNYLYENTYFDRPDRGFLKDVAVAEAKAALERRALSAAERDGIIYAEKEKNGETKRTMRSKKGNWGYAFEQEGRFFIELNFQIRFK